MTALETVFDYHQRTKHDLDKYARSLGYMDWANQPIPFRFYNDAPEIQLDLDRKPPPTPFERLYQSNGVSPAPLDLGTISDFFRYSLALTAWKQAGSNRWSLRANPSSGNLHPTEAYVALPPLDVENQSDGNDKNEAQSTLYHYLSKTHILERRATFSDDIWNALTGELPEGSFLVGLGSVLWREAWKYGERAFRYCQHDVGHAVAGLRFSAALLGWRMKLVSSWSSTDVAALLGLDREDEFFAPEREEAELIAVVTPNSKDPTLEPVFPPPTKTIIDKIHSAAWIGRPNRLSSKHIVWSVIDEVAKATRQGAVKETISAEPDNNWRPMAAPPDVDAHQIIQQRRSSQALDGASSVSLEKFLRMLGSALPGRDPPWDVLCWPTMIHLALFVHRVDNLTPGIYLLVRDPAKKEQLKQAMSDTFVWSKPETIPNEFPLYLLKESDCRETARTLSCHQDIAADGFFSLGMIAEFEEPIRRRGGWFYRNLFWEAGAIGQVLYLEAEAIDTRSTGIGCYFDDPVHDILGLEGNQFQSLYHFTVGIPVEDRRLQTLPPYDV